MADAVERAREARGALERLGSHIPGFRGYLERELRREMDHLLRFELAARLDRARDGVARHLGALAPASPTVTRLASLDKALDTVANTLRHAGTGYAGAFAALKVHEEQLVTLYRYDESLLHHVETAVAAAGRLAADDAALARLEESVSALRSSVEGRDAAVRSVFA